MGYHEEISVFAEIARTGSISAAADSLGLAPSVVSRRLKNLEERLQTNLFHRTTRSVSLTEAGHVYASHAARILEQVDAAESDLSGLSGTLSGTIRIAAPMSFGLIYLADALSSFLKTYPSLQIDLDMNDRFVDLTKEGFDLALRIGDLTDSSLMATKIADISSAVAASPAFIEQHGPFSQPEDMNGLPGLNYSPKSKPEVYSYTTREGRQGHVTLAQTLKCNSGTLTRDMAVNGDGLISMPLFIMDKALKDGTLVQLFPDCHWGSTSLHAVWPPGRHLARRTRVLIDYFRETFRQIPLQN